MTVSVASARNIISKDTPQSLVPSTSTTLAWTRPSDWLTLPAVGPTDQKFVGLLAVYDNDTNYVALRATANTGTYTVDWGDGTSPQTYTSNTVAQYKYNYATISSGTISTRGYKQVIITVTATTANLTGIDLQQKFSTTPVLPNATLRWLDIRLGSPQLNNLLIIGGTIPPALLERAEIVSITSTPIALFPNLFSNCYNLQSVIFSGSMAANTTALSMFNNCYGLKIAPSFDTSNVTTMNGMFTNCYNLQSVPAYNTVKVTDFTNTFNTCRSIQTIPLMDTGNVTLMVQTFTGCAILKNIPLLNTIKVANTFNMFSGCLDLVSIPSFNLSNVTDASSMFASCYSLKSTPTLNTSNATLTVSMFNSCFGLTTVGNIDLSNATNTSSMFISCNALVNLPTLNTAKVTNAASMFNSCSSLQSIPTMDFSNISIMTSMFSSSGLSGVINLSLPKATNLATAFQTNYNLTGFNFTGSTSTFSNINLTFSSCSSLVNISNLNLVNCISAGTTGGFNSCTSLSNAGISNVKIGFTIASCNFGKADLENIFANSLVNNTSVQTCTITGNPGADTANAKTSGTIAGSSTITMANTVGITGGSYIYGTGINTGIPVTFTASTSTVVYTNGGGVNGLANGDSVMFTAIVTTTGIVVNTTYFVVNRTGTTFQISATVGGAALTLTNNGTGTMSIGGATSSNRVLSINANVNVIINGVAGITNAAAALTARNLCTNYAVTKNWTITG